MLDTEFIKQAFSPISAPTTRQMQCMQNNALGQTTKMLMVSARPAATLEGVMHIRAIVDPSKLRFMDPAHKIDLKLMGAYQNKILNLKVFFYISISHTG